MADTVYGTQFMESSFNKNVAALADEYGRNVWSTAFQESAAPLTMRNPWCRPAHRWCNCADRIPGCHKRWSASHR